MRKEYLKNEKHFSFFSTCSHTLPSILLTKKLGLFGNTFNRKIRFPQKPINRLSFLSSQLTGFHMTRAINTKCFRKDIKETQEIKSQINQVPARQFLHSLHRQLCRFQVLMVFLKSIKDSFCFISRDTRSQILGPKHEMVSVPLNIDFIMDLLNSD